MQDYRAQSYKKRAASAFSQSPSAGYDVSINQENIVSGYGQVAIAPDKNTVGGELSFTEKTQPTSSSETSVNPSEASTPASTVSGAAMLAFQSPELASAAREGRLQPTSVSAGQAYQMSFRGDNKPTTAYVIGSKFEKKTVVETKKPSKIEKIKNIITTPFNYAFTPQPIPFQETTQAQVEGREAFSNVLLFGAMGATARPTTLKSSKVTFGVQQTAQVVESEAGFNTNIKVTGAGYSRSKLFGVEYGKPKSFKVTGNIVETAKPIDTEIFGLVGDEQVFGTKATGKFVVTNGKKTLSSSFESKGFEVAGAGKREVVQQVGTAPAEKFSEVFITESSGDVTRGGVVSSKGALGFVSKSEAEVSLVKNKGNVYYNPETGLESSTPTLQFKPSETVTVRYLKISGSGKSNPPMSAEYIYESAGGRIRSNLNPVADLTGRDVVGGSVSDVSRSQVLQSQTVSKVPSGIQSFNSNQLISSTLKEPVVSIKLPSPGAGVVNVGSPKVKNEGVVSNVVNVQSTRVVPQTVSTFSMGASQSVSAVGAVGTGSVLGQSQFSGLGRVSKQRPSVIQNPIVSTGVVSSQEVLGRQGLRSVQAQSQVQAFSVVQSSKFNSARGLGGVGSAPPAFTSSPVIKGFGFNMPKSGGGVFGVEVRRGGVFRQVGSGLSLKGAVGLGQSRVSGSAAATFRVTQGGAPIRIQAPIGGQFYSKGTSVIEKNKYRITSPGELSEITFKGIRTQRGK
jgi:hypothetical protein